MLPIEHYQQKLNTHAMHSRRRGGRMHARRCGPSKEKVKIIGRWRSDVIDLYYAGTST
jgi:hypothetical protein